MAILDLFSKRQKRLRGEQPDILTYDDLPKPLRVQIIYIWREVIGKNSYGYLHDVTVPQLYNGIRDLLRTEYGVFCLTEQDFGDADNELERFFLAGKDIEKLIDQVEITFRLIENVVARQTYQSQLQSQTDPEKAINELNARFLEHGIGYQYESQQIIRADSTLLHAEVIKPALQILGRSEYAGANTEFLKAHEHYRHGHYKESMNESLKALESVLKIICSKRKWAYNQTDTAKRLIEICFENQLVPNYLQSQFSSLRSILESGVPTTRNKASAHGQGVASITVPSHLAQYVLHLTASTVLFLSEAEEQLS